MAAPPISGAESFTEGVNASQNVINNWRKNKAMNALTKIYGDIAGDPEDALKMQDYQQKEQMNPLLVQGEQLKNTGADLGNQKAAAELPYAGPKQQADVAETQARTGLYGAQTDAQKAATPYIAAEKTAGIASTQAGTANTQQQTATGAFNLQQGKAQADRAQLGAILTTLTNTASTGGDIGAAFDKYAPIISSVTGGDPTKLSALRKRMVADPQNTIQDLYSGLLAQNLLMPGKTGAKNPMQDRAQQVAAMQVIGERTKAVPNTIAQAVALIPQMSGSAIIRKAKEKVPGTAEYKFDQLVQSVKSNLSLDDLRSLRTSGLSLGRTNIAEFTASANAFGNVDLGQDPRVLAQTLTRLGGTYNVINSTLQADIKRMSFGVPGLNAGQNAQPQAAKQTGGKPSAQGLDAFITKHGGIDGAIAAASSDAMAQALSDRYEETHHLGRFAGKGKTTSGPGQVYHYDPKTGQLQ